MKKTKRKKEKKWRGKHGKVMLCFLGRALMRPKSPSQIMPFERIKIVAYTSTHN